MSATATAKRRGLPEGIQERHREACNFHTGGRCNCQRSYRASVYDPRVKRNVYSGWQRDLPTVQKWRTQAQRELDAELQAGVSPAGQSPILRDEWKLWLKGARAGAFSNRNGDRYKPSTLEGYERSWRNHIDAEFGHKRIGTVTHRELQKWVEKEAAAGVKRSTINNALDPLRVLFRRALKRGEVRTNPTLDLDLPARAEEEVKIVSPEEAAALIAALPRDEQALWATAFYAGLRRGELRSIRWKHIDLPAQGIGTMTVLRSWSDADETGPKSKAGRRRVPIVPQLASHLREHRKRTGRKDDDLVFGRTASKPFEPTTVRSRALKAWKEHKPPLEPVTLHQCRHTAASFLIHAGANAKAISAAMGHASVETTFNRYGHLMKGNEEEVGNLLASYLKNPSRRNGIGMADT